VCLSLAVSGAVSSSAAARIGNPIKKAKEKLQKAVEPAAEPQTGNDVVFDNVVVELTNARVENIVAAFEKAKQAGAGRSALVEQLNQKNEERGKLMDKEGDAMSALRNKRDDINQCNQEGYSKAKDRKMEEYSKRAMSDPQLMAKFAKIAQENNAAVARGDSAAAARANNGILAEMLPSSEDSAAIRKSCGALPPKSAAEIRLEGLEKEIASLDEQLRAFDQKVAKAQAKEGGLTDQQWGVALERTQMYMDGSNASANAPRARKGKSGNPSGDQGSQNGTGNTTSDGHPATITIQPRKGFSNAEVEVLEKHLEKLRAALR
jgi:predicted  nucleic acid-binding Zn-ribbon protein